MCEGNLAICILLKLILCSHDLESSKEMIFQEIENNNLSLTQDEKKEHSEILKYCKLYKEIIIKGEESEIMKCKILYKILENKGNPDSIFMEIFMFQNYEIPEEQIKNFFKKLNTLRSLNTLIRTSYAIEKRRLEVA